MRSRVVTAIALVFAVATATPALAQSDKDEEEARRLFVEASKRLKAGDLEGALAGYRAAYEVVPRPKILLNIGAVLAELKRNAEFANVYQEYANHPARDRERDDGIRDILREVDTKVGRLRFEVADGAVIEVDGAAIGKTPIESPWRVEPGTHVVTAIFESGQAFKEIEVARGKEVTVSLEAPARAKDEDTGDPDPDPGKPRRLRDDGPPIYKKAWLWTGVGAVAAAGVGIGFGLAATRAEDDYRALLDQGNPPYTRAKELEDRGKRNALISNVAFISAGALAITGGVLFYLDRRSGDDDSGAEDEGFEVSVAPLGSDGAMVSLRGWTW